MQNSSVQYTQQITSLTTLEERWLINLTATKNMIIKYLQKKTSTENKTWTTICVWNAANTFLVRKNLFHYPHQSTQGV